MSSARWDVKQPHYTTCSYDWGADIKYNARYLTAYSAYIGGAAKTNSEGGESLYTKQTFGPL